ncbi:hypothetical protein I553_6191 [Mycobacterium xenopi 4042]|uniref:Uncharacterized protein n=1 Tax=Mycobacterium xenopi 4042 TaxID=1299334 RepID=X8BFW0_MYCXE|nr:hypothetical protein I553_6191 [Mycobacterium xenopi 4042]
MRRCGPAKRKELMRERCDAAHRRSVEPLPAGICTLALRQVDGQGTLVE